MPKASATVGICGENISYVATDFIGLGMVLTGAISSLRWEVLMPSLFQWGGEQQGMLIPGAGQRA